MKHYLLAVGIILVVIPGTVAQPGEQANQMTLSAQKFMESLNPGQRAKASFPFTDNERYNWKFVPAERKGIPLRELNETQRKAGLDLLRVALSESGYNKTLAIIQLEYVLREVEGRPAEDEYRNPGKYYFSIFGNPSTDKIWGWRLEGHHVAFNFSTENNKLISGTPSFLGSNPAIILSGPEKGKHILKDETTSGLAMLNSLDEDQLGKAIISTRAPGDILTGNSRKALISEPKGILYSELKASQQKLLLELLSLYIQRYSKVMSLAMMKEIEDAGLSNLRFAWAGDKTTGPGHPHYYRIHGPTIIIEYDNIQNNANHIHTVIRDLKFDFGGDELAEHYKTVKHH